MLGKHHQTNTIHDLNSPTNIADREEPVQVVDGQTEDLGRAVLLLADLQHPVSHLFPHVRLQVCLDGIEIILASGGKMLHFPPYQSSQNSFIAKNIGVTVRS